MASPREFWSARQYFRLPRLVSGVTLVMSLPFPPRGGGPHLVDHHSRQPAWKRIHRSPFFWVAAVFILGAMVIYIATGNLARAPGQPAGEPVPALAP